jgi:hypothetical protein
VPTHLTFENLASRVGTLRFPTPQLPLPACGERVGVRGPLRWARAAKRLWRCPMVAVPIVGFEARDADDAAERRPGDFMAARNSS